MRVAGVLFLGVLAGCASPDMTDARAMRGIERAEDSVGAPHRPVRIADADGPALTIGGDRVSWDAILPALAEAGGRIVIEEAMLDTALERECRRRGVTVTEADLQAERARFVEAASIAGERGEQALERIRRARGLGPVRFEAMLRRTARLRALVRDRVAITDTALARAHREMYGPRYDLRVIVTSTAVDAQAALDRLRAGTPFADEAMQRSIDASAGAGGLLRGVSPDDLAWPQAIRSAIPEMRPGETRGPIALEQGWAIIRMEAETPADPDAPAIEVARSELERLVRLAQERVLMEAESRRLLAGVSATADPRLRWALESAQ